MIRFCVLIVFITSFLYSAATDITEYYNIKHITSENGLPHNLVFDITQSDDGFVWLATNNGLGRYDGYSFKTFRHEKKKSKGLSNKSASKLFIDHDNKMWISINGMGVNRMNLNDYTFTHLNYDSKNSNSITGNNAVVYLQPNDSTVWIGTNKGLNCYNNNTDFTTNYPFKDNNSYIADITEDINKNLWVNLSTNLFFFNTSTGKYESAYNKTGISLLKDLHLTDFLMIDKKTLVIGTQKKGLIIFDTETNSIVKHIPEVYSSNNLYLSSNGNLYFISYTHTAFLNVINDFANNSFSHKTLEELSGIYNFPPGEYCEDSKSNIWLSAGNNLYKIHPDNSINLIKLKHQSGNTYNESTLTTFIDNMDNLWMKTSRNGVVILNVNQKKFSTYSYLNNKIISDKNISMVYVDATNRIWVGSYNKGVTCYSQETNEYIDFPYKAMGDNTKQITYKAPAGMCEDLYGNIWVGFYESNTIMINPKTKKLKTFAYADSNYNEYNLMHSIRCIIPDSTKLWFASSSIGIVEYNTNTNEYLYHSKLYEKDYDKNSHYRFLLRTKDGNFWSGSQNGGLTCYNSESAEFIRFKNEPENNTSICSNTVYFIHEHNKDTLWIGTDKGLVIFDRNNETFDLITENGEDNKYSIYRIYPDNNNNLWLSGDSGLKKINLETYEVTTYSTLDGLPTNQFNTTAGHKSENGEIFLGTSNGLISFSPDEITNDPFPAKPKLTSLKIFNKEISPYDSVKGYVALTKTISTTKRITLPHYLNDFTIEFSSMHFAAPEKNKYQYKLEGFSDEWIDTDAKRRWANFTGLKHGDYIFHLRASNSDGIFCNEEDSVKLHIIIKPPFYKTWYSKSILIILLIIIAYLMHRLRTRNINNQNTKLEKLILLRTQELKSQNLQLKENKEEITQQKEELEIHRNHLQELVHEKTADLQEALKKAEESDHLKSAFLANMSHEIRTPMNAILGFASLMNNDDVTEKEMFQFSEMIHSNAETLLNLLNDIIDISIIESGELIINKTDIEVDKLVKEVVSVYSKNGVCISNNNIRIEHSSHPEYFHTDPHRLKQIINNLIANAIKFTNDGNISISYRKTGTEIQFEVCDTGIGIEKDKLSLVFDRFIKLENMTNEVYRGGGLGLSICKKLTEILGGKIWVKSETGKGSSFYFTIIE